MNTRTTAFGAALDAEAFALFVNGNGLRGRGVFMRRFLKKDYSASLKKIARMRAG
jgi:hypothetical protein